jgi:hypothetical protein
LYPSFPAFLHSHLKKGFPSCTWVFEKKYYQSKYTLEGYSWACGEREAVFVEDVWKKKFSEKLYVVKIVTSEIKTGVRQEVNDIYVKALPNDEEERIKLIFQDSTKTFKAHWYRDMTREAKQNRIHPDPGCGTAARIYMYAGHNDPKDRALNQAEAKKMISRWLTESERGMKGNEKREH